MTYFLLPLFFGSATFWAAYRWALFPTFVDAAALSAFGGTVASISATMMGFMLAALAVLASINHTHLVKMMRQYGHYSDLLRTMMLGAVLFLACTLCGYALLFGMQGGQLSLSIVVGVHFAALASLMDVGRKLWYVLSSLRSS